MRAPPGRAPIGHVDDETLRKSFELNFWAHQTVAQQATRIMQAQGTFGCLLFNTSKQAVNPGKDFGPYGLPKAATLFLVKQYALDHGKDGIRANAVNADRIRTGLLTDEMVAKRSAARGVSEADYMSGNLLKREVTAEDVADAFVYLATATKTTAAVITVDGGILKRVCGNISCDSRHQSWSYPMKVPVDIEYADIENDSGREIEGLCATCDRCGHSVQVLGITPSSARYAAVLLGQDMP